MSRQRCQIDGLLCGWRLARHYIGGADSPESTRGVDLAAGLQGKTAPQVAGAAGWLAGLGSYGQTQFAICSSLVKPDLAVVIVPELLQGRVGTVAQMQG